MVHTTALQTQTARGWIAALTPRGWSASDIDKGVCRGSGKHGRVSAWALGCRRSHVVQENPGHTAGSIRTASCGPLSASEDLNQ